MKEDIIMKSGLCLRIYLSESDQIDHVPALEAILQLCKDAGLHGVSVMRGIEGMGKHGMHSVSFLSLSSSLPLIVEVVASKTDIEHAIHVIQPKLPHVTIVTWAIQMIQSEGNIHR
ncbi:MAG: DUF190 domain-containing protein [Mariprofundaceae bacterium]|nr:DUF190 domain-containing protein [Mariprofundaceae bacterium]